jgi:hypothetical protein
VVWNRDGRCGLSLGCPIVVADWIAGASSNASGPSLGQARVDQIQVGDPQRRGPARRIPGAAAQAGSSRTDRARHRATNSRA